MKKEEILATMKRRAQKQLEIAYDKGYEKGLKDRKGTQQGNGDRTEVEAITSEYSRIINQLKKEIESAYQEGFNAGRNLDVVGNATDPKAIEDKAFDDCWHLCGDLLKGKYSDVPGLPVDGSLVIKQYSVDYVRKQIDHYENPDMSFHIGEEIVNKHGHRGVVIAANPAGTLSVLYPDNICIQTLDASDVVSRTGLVYTQLAGVIENVKKSYGDEEGN